MSDFTTVDRRQALPMRSDVHWVRNSATLSHSQEQNMQICDGFRWPRPSLSVCTWCQGVKCHSTVQLAFSDYHLSSFLHFKPKNVSSMGQSLKNRQHSTKNIRSFFGFMGGWGVTCLVGMEKEQLYHPNYFRTLVCRDLQRRR